MVNLLFISNNSKINTIKKILQPLLKVKIDIVTDFDYGLKDVFEKRPATVFIQDHIAGVTGESVARHIQMLLGSGSPSFIFMHEGNVKVKPINGLFEHLIDLSPTGEKISEDIQAILKTLLGSQWDKIFIPPKIDVAAIKKAVAVPKGRRDVADQLVDDFISDLDNSGSVANEIAGQSTDLSEPLTPADVSDIAVFSHHDQLAEMLAESSWQSNNTKTKTATNRDVTDKKPSVTSHEMVSTQHVLQTVVSKSSETPISETPIHDIAPPQPEAGVAAPAVTLNSTLTDGVEVPSPPRSVSDNPPLQSVSPADFIIGREESPLEEAAPEDLLHVFEDNYYSQSGGWKRYVTIVVVLAICAGGGLWYLLKQKPHFFAFISKPTVQSVVVPPVARTVEPAISTEKPVSIPAQKGAEPVLPSFIPQSGLDRSYATLNPGWDRYVDTTLEFRVFRVDGKIKALQVVGLNNHFISEPKMKTILNELLGDGEYREKLREQKHGYQILRATGGQKSELLIYRNKTSIRAFVVSLN